MKLVRHVIVKQQPVFSVTEVPDVSIGEWVQLSRWRCLARSQARRSQRTRFLNVQNSGAH